MFDNPRRGRQARNLTKNVPKILDLKSSSEQIFSENWRWVPLKLVLTMLTISFVSECRLWKACLTTFWHSFQANTCSKKSSAKLFWVYWSDSRTGCCRSTTRFGKILIYLPLVRGSETQTKRKECSISCIAIADVIYDQVEAMDFKTILYQNINYLLNCNYQLSTLCRVIRFLLHLPLVFL